MDKGASLWNPSSRVGRPTDVTHGSAPDHIKKNTAVGDAVSAKSDYKYEPILKFGGKTRNLSAKRMQGVDHLWIQLLLVQNATPQKINTINEIVKTKIKAQKEYVPDDPESEPSFPDSSLSEYDSYDDRKYKNKRCNKEKNNRKRTKTGLVRLIVE